MVFKIRIVKRKGMFLIMTGKRVLGRTTTKAAAIIEARAFRATARRIRNR